MIGALIYSTVGTRPDICEAVSKLASYSADPRKVHKRAVERTMTKHFFNTRHCNLHCRHGGELKALADASHACCKKTGYSRTGFLLFCAHSPVCWRSAKQTVVAQSARDAECIAASDCSRDIIFIREFMKEIYQHLKKPLDLQPTILHCDCQPALDTIFRDGFSNKSKSIRLSYHNLQDLHKKHEINPTKISSEDNTADIMTKPLTQQQTLKHCLKMFKV